MVIYVCVYAFGWICVFVCMYVCVYVCMRGSSSCSFMACGNICVHIHMYSVYMYTCKSSPVGDTCVLYICIYDDTCIYVYM